MYKEIRDSLYTGNLRRISTYKITKVKFAKLQIGYGVVFNIRMTRPVKINVYNFYFKPKIFAVYIIVYDRFYAIQYF